jgi:hypothetical protein
MVNRGVGRQREIIVRDASKTTHSLRLRVLKTTPTDSARKNKQGRRTGGFQFDDNHLQRRKWSIVELVDGEK